MLFEIHPPDDSAGNMVDQIHEQLKPAIAHLEQGGQVTVMHERKVIGVAETVEELFALVIR